MDQKKPNYKTGRLLDDLHSSKNLPSSRKVALTDEKNNVEAIGRSDDGSDDTLVSHYVAKSAAIKVIGKLTAVSPVTVKVDMQKGDECQSFEFFRSWTVYWTVMKPASGQLTFVNVTYFTADEKLALEDLLTGRPVLQHLQVESCTLLENNPTILDGNDCSHIGNPIVSDSGGQIIRITVAGLNRILNSHVSQSRRDLL